MLHSHACAQFFVSLFEKSGAPKRGGWGGGSDPQDQKGGLGGEPPGPPLHLDFYSVTYNMSFSRFLIEVRGPTSEKLNQGYT